MSQENGTYLSRDEILKIQDVRAEDVKVEAWGNRVVRVRALTASEASWYRAEQIRAIADELREGKQGPANVLALVGQAARAGELRVRLVRMCCIDTVNQPLFEESDEPALGAMSDEAIDRIAATVLRLSKITPEAEAEAVESAKDFSEGTPASG
jgi:hypothetical protein